jgi:putative oxidoreductase
MGGFHGFLTHRATVRVAQLAIGVLFLVAALGKIGDLSNFALQVHNYRLAPLWSQNFIAMTLPWVELLAGLALVLGVRPRAGAVILLVLMIGFTVAVGAAWARGLDFECGCFGKASASRIGAQKLIENLGWLVVAAVAAVPPRPGS